MIAQDISLLIYNLALLPVVFFSILFLLLATLSIYADRKTEKLVAPKKHPFVTVQVPSFNDPVAARCIEACMNFNYPKDKYEIMILDDSTKKETSRMLRKYADKNPGFVSFIHRDNRQGYKPGALKEAMPFVRGEIIVLFDADFIPDKDFLARIVQPFENPKVAIVQARQTFLNMRQNLVTRFASYLLMIHHAILMPINNKLNTVFFCGTAGAIRKSAMESVGGWNTTSITEDSELSVKILAKGYKNIYIQFETPSEVPDTIEGFVKQQMRWTFGNVRVFMDNKRQILFGKGFRLRQRAMISFMTMGTIIAPIIIVMTIAGFSGWFSGEPELLTMASLSEFFIKFFFTAGFLLMGTLALYKHKSLNEFPHLLLATFSISIILACANSVAVFKALFRKDKPLFKAQNSWICTPKTGNVGYEKR